MQNLSKQNFKKSFCNEEETEKYIKMVSMSFYEAIETDIDVRSYRETKITEILN